MCGGFFFLFFLHGFLIGNGQQGISYNGVTRAGFEKCIQDAKGMEKEQMRYFIQVGYYAHSQGHKKDEELYNYWIDNFNK